MLVYGSVYLLGGIYYYMDIICEIREGGLALHCWEVLFVSGVRC